CTIGSGRVVFLGQRETRFRVPKGQLLAGKTTAVHSRARRFGCPRVGAEIQGVIARIGTRIATLASAAIWRQDHQPSRTRITTIRLAGIAAMLLCALGSPPAEARPQGTLPTTASRAAAARQRTHAPSCNRSRGLARRCAVTVAPRLTAVGEVLAWTATARHNHYVLKTFVPGAAPTRAIIVGTTVRPATHPGPTVVYEVRTLARRLWSNQVSIAYPPRPAQAGGMGREAARQTPGAPAPSGKGKAFGRNEREAKEIAEREAKERAEREAREKAEREAKERAEREAKERAEREAKERAEREAKERAEREAKERAEREAREK